MVQAGKEMLAEGEGALQLSLSQKRLDSSIEKW